MFLRLPGNARKQITEKLDYYLATENPFVFAKKLTGANNKWRWKSGNYRIIFEQEPDGSMVCLLVLKVGHRQSVYED